MKRPTQKSLDRYARLFNQSATMRIFGCSVSFPRAREVLVTMDPVRPEHRGGLGSDAVNGGVIAAMFDLAIGCTPALIDPGRRTATVELSMQFMRGVRGDRFTVRSKIDRAGTSLIFSSATLFDERGQACAACRGIAMLSSATWTTKGTPAIN
jgi:uncharacterized protein (TIGR00369 family)